MRRTACKRLAPALFSAAGGGALALLAASVFAAPEGPAASPSDRNGPGATTLACSTLGGEAPQTPVGWLTESLKASHCYRFQARAVAIDALNVRTLALSHRIQDGVRQQVIQHLDGPSVNVERHARAGLWGWPSARSGQSESAAPMPRRWAEHVASVYDIALARDERVAGREAVRLTFTPQSGNRYRHQWWLDQQTGLLLKHVLRDDSDVILETFQITRLQTPTRYARDVSVTPPEQKAGPNWQVGWLPGGMVEQPNTLQNARANRTSRLYSDGLATVSVFVESPAAATLATGVHRLGASAIAVERHAGDHPWQVIAIGEVPPELLGRIARSVTRSDAPSPDAAGNP